MRYCECRTGLGCQSHMPWKPYLKVAQLCNLLSTSTPFTFSRPWHPLEADGPLLLLPSSATSEPVCCSFIFFSFILHSVSLLVPAVAQPGQACEVACFLLVTTRALLIMHTGCGSVSLVCEYLFLFPSLFAFFLPEERQAQESRTNLLLPSHFLPPQFLW